MNIFIDTFNLGYCARKRYNKQVDYEKLADNIGPGKYTAYVVRTTSPVDNFVNYLEELDFKVDVCDAKPIKFAGLKRPFWQSDHIITMARDLLLCDNSDDLTVVSSDVRLLPIYQTLKKQFEIWGIGLPRRLKDFGHYELGSEDL